LAACLVLPPSSIFPITPPALAAISTLSLHDALPIYIIQQSMSSSGQPLITGQGQTQRLLFRLRNLITKNCDQALPCWVERVITRSEEHTSELQSLTNLVCRLLLEKKNSTIRVYTRCT